MGRVSAAEQRARALVERLPEHRIVGVEVGVYDGRMSEWILRLRDDLTLWMVDNWFPGEKQSKAYRATGDPRARLTADQAARACLTAVDRTSFAADRRALVRDDSAAAAGRFRDQSLDFVFVDADHSHEGVTRDIRAWAPKVKPGGLLCGHDYSDPRFHVARAVDAVASAQGWNVATGADGTWFVTMPTFVAA